MINYDQKNEVIMFYKATNLESRRKNMVLTFGAGY